MKKKCILLIFLLISLTSCAFFYEYWEPSDLILYLTPPTISLTTPTNGENFYKREVFFSGTVSDVSTTAGNVFSTMEESNWEMYDLDNFCWEIDYTFGSYGTKTNLFKASFENSESKIITNIIHLTAALLETSPGISDRLRYGSVQLGDIDSDNDLDMIASGFNNSTIKTIIYQNDGQGGFAEINPGSLIGVINSCIVFADVDDDSNLDLILAGENSGNPYSKIYQNDGQGDFTEINPGSLTNISICSIVVGDLNNDGKTDLIMSGKNNSDDAISKIMTNDGTGSFSEVSSGLISGVLTGSIDVGDINGDTYIDLIITGNKQDGIKDYVTEIYTNAGDANFFKIPSVEIPAVAASSIDLADLDNDNDLDLVITGETSSQQKISKIFVNNGSGTFTEKVQIVLDNVAWGSIDLGDIDGDQDIDLIITGHRGDQLISKLYYNSGDAEFVNEDPDLLTGIWNGEIDLGDIDGDGDLDLVFAADDNLQGVVGIYLNQFNNGGYSSHSIGED